MLAKERGTVADAAIRRPRNYARLLGFKVHWQRAIKIEKIQIKVASTYSTKPSPLSDRDFRRSL